VLSSTVFGLKAGLAIGRAVASWMLSLFGYVPNAIQSVDSMLGIKSIASVLAALVFFLGVACLFLCRIDTKTNIQRTRESAARRKEHAS
jgi:GPH family glycoside/pentoside/hexuronide:cation symporter